MTLPAGLSQVKLKQLLWPSVWCILIIILIGNNSKSFIASTPAWTLSGNSSQVFSIPEKLTGTLKQYFDGVNYSVREEMATDASIVTANISSSDKVAVIIETRQSGAIIPLVLHFASVLGPDWPVVIYTSAENYYTFSTSHALLRYQKMGRIVVRALAKEIYFPNWDSVSWFLTQKMMWEDLAPAEHILVFQNDAILCSNAVRSVEEFFEWDFIGAPVLPRFGQGYNGGLSLRKRSSTLRVLENFDWNKYGGMRAEDQWYFHRLEELIKMDEDEGIESLIKMPSMEIARTFAVETIDYPNPLGFHQPTRYLTDETHMKELREWCPEFVLARSDRNF